ncbi:hypothetical protein BGZ59_008507 [Podila verticillata]|nr:hypothetical protein BGZ59_008507 [Podila verticillata]
MAGCAMRPALNSDVWIKYGIGSTADSARKLSKDANDAAKDSTNINDQALEQAEIEDIE